MGGEGLGRRDQPASRLTARARRIVCVVGPPCSGSEVVAGLLRRAGFQPPPAPLSALEREARATGGLLEDLRRSASRLLGDVEQPVLLTGHDLLGSWRRLVPDLPHILCVRDPRSAVTALAADAGVSPHEAEVMWLAELRAALQDGDGAPRLVVRDDAWGRRPRHEAERVARFAGVARHVLGPDDVAGIERTPGASEHRLSEEASALWSVLAQLADTDPREAPEPARDAARERDQLLAGGIVAIRDVADALQRIGASRSWRYGHAVARAVSAVRGRGAGTTDAVDSARSQLEAYLARARASNAVDAPAPAVEARRPTRPVPLDEDAIEELAGALRARLGSSPPAAVGAVVSAIVVNRDGLAHLRQLVPRLDRLSGDSLLELIVVDNGSSDGSLEYLSELRLRFPVRVIPNASNQSYAAANNQGAAEAAGDLLLLLNNDVIPFQAGWLAELVACRERTGAALTGARLIHAERDGERPSGWRLQHRGIAFTLEEGVPRAVNLGDGDDAVDDGHVGEDLFVPAVTAACLLVGADEFHELGGLDGRYWYGSEDVDLGLAVAALGRPAVVCGRSALLHDESATQRAQDGSARRINQIVNRAALLSRWGPRLRREVVLDRIASGGAWSTGALCVALDGDREETVRLADGLRALGLRPAEKPGEADVTVSMSDPEPDAVPTPTLPIKWRPPAGAPAREAADALVEVVEQRERRLRFCIKIGAPGWHVAKQWGDLHFAGAVQRELERRGHACLIQTADEWDALGGLTYDVAVQLKGRGTYLPRPGQLNVLWSISHPEDLVPWECDGFDLVCVASQRFARVLASRTATPVAVLEQATDPAAFFPEPDAAHRCDAVFVGNTRGVDRVAARALSTASADVRFWGRGWQDVVPASRYGGPYLAPPDVRRAYSSATMVVNDHWLDMRSHGYVSNRVYDALACGTLVLSDDMPELAELGDGVVRYGSEEELRALVADWAARPAEARALAAHGREVVLAGHTFAHRVDRLLELVRQRRGELGYHARLQRQDSPGGG